MAGERGARTIRFGQTEAMIDSRLSMVTDEPLGRSTFDHQHRALGALHHALGDRPH